MAVDVQRSLEQERLREGCLSKTRSEGGAFRRWRHTLLFYFWIRGSFSVKLIAYFKEKYDSSSTRRLSTPACVLNHRCHQLYTVDKQPPAPVKNFFPSPGYLYLSFTEWRISEWTHTCVLYCVRANCKNNYKWKRNGQRQRKIERERVTERNKKRMSPWHRTQYFLTLQQIMVLI